MQWRATDPGPTAVKVRRQVSIADVPNFKRLTISLEGTTSHDSQYSLTDPVTLPAINRQTRQNIVLTLAARQAILRGRHPPRLQHPAGRRQPGHTPRLHRVFERQEQRRADQLRGDQHRASALNAGCRRQAFTLRRHRTGRLRTNGEAKTIAQCCAARPPGPAGGTRPT